MNSYSLIDPYKPSSADDIAGNQYTQLMNWALDHSDAVMLVYRCYHYHGIKQHWSQTKSIRMLVYHYRHYYKTKQHWSHINSIRDRLAPHRIHSRSTPTRWPGTT